MAYLIAQGREAAQRWRRTLIDDKLVVLGRGQGGFTIDWDDRISRRHAELTWDGAQLGVRRIDSARNPIFTQGHENDRFFISPGEHFVIGQTTFTVVDQQAEVTIEAPQPLRQQTFSPQYLQQLRFRSAKTRIDVLGRLPEVISGAATDDELFVRLTGLLMAGIPSADAVALVRIGDDEADPAPIDILHWDRRLLSARSFEPSENLIRAAISSGESVLHMWGRGDDSGFTAQEDIDWAFCTPVAGDACRGWAVYVAGGFGSPAGQGSASDPTDLRDDLKFTEVAAATLRSLQELRQLQKQRAWQSRFFSPVVLDALASEDWEAALAPRESNVSVLFCDLRGFSRESEKSAGDLLGLLDRVSKALGVTTQQILAEGGVVGDLQGDAVMGFWGWPIDDAGRIRHAVRAALSIRAAMAHAARQAGDPLAGFRLGIGIASGRAVAGRIGTVDQVKVTVFGPVANLASRLEALTKTLRAPILLDEPTAQFVRNEIPSQVARCRRLAKVKPYGMQTAVEVSELLPPAEEYPQLSDQHVADYEAALTAFQQGDWPVAFELLHKVPADDRAKDFLTVLIAQHNRTAPEGWDGVIELHNK